MLAKFLMAAALSAGATQALAAESMFMTVDGAKQGKFKGDTTQKGKQNDIALTGFNYSVVSPRDAATGQATGKRQHSPMSIVKQWDAASPQFMEAMITNEMLTSVVVELAKSSAGGIGAATTYKITCKNAQITSIVQAASEVAGVLVPTETIQMVCQTMEQDDSAGKTTVIDNILNLD